MTSSIFELVGARTMTRYGQYCPVAQALEILGDRWTMLIIRDMLGGTQHFNDLQRGLPGISRSVLADRLRLLQDAGIIEKHIKPSGRRTTEYHLTQAGWDLNGVITALLMWGATWAFGDPSPEQLDPLLLMWWMRGRVNQECLPEPRIVVQFNFRGAAVETYWLMMTSDDITICLTDPGYEINILVTADLATYFKVWLGRLDYEEAVQSDAVEVVGIPRFVRAFPDWFNWSAAAPAVRAKQPQ